MLALQLDNFGTRRPREYEILNLLTDDIVSVVLHTILMQMVHEGFFVLGEECIPECLPKVSRDFPM